MTSLAGKKITVNKSDKGVAGKKALFDKRRLSVHHKSKQKQQNSKKEENKSEIQTDTFALDIYPNGSSEFNRFEYNAIGGKNIYLNPDLYREVKTPVPYVTYKSPLPDHSGSVDESISDMDVIDESMANVSDDENSHESSDVDFVIEDALLLNLPHFQYKNVARPRSMRVPETVLDNKTTPQNILADAIAANELGLNGMINNLGKGHPSVIKRKLQTADLYKGLGMVKKVEQLLIEAIEELRERYDAELNTYTQNASKRKGPMPIAMTVAGTSLSSAFNDLGLLYTAQKRYHEAELIFYEAIGVLVTLHPSQPHSDIAITLCNVAICHRQAFEFVKAISEHERAIKIMEDINGHEHPETIFQKAHLGITTKKSGDAARGEKNILDAVVALEAMGYRDTHIWMKTFTAELPSTLGY